MSTDATGLPSGAAGAANTGLDAAADAASAAGARHIRTLDDRLTLLLSRMTYVALSFYFALFYLQLINQNGLWKPTGIDHPASWIGVVQTAAVLIAGLAYFWGQWAGLYQRNFQVLQIGLWVATLLCIVADVVHIIELHTPGFSLQGGGYVSVFIATEGTFTVLLILTTLVMLGMANRARLGLFAQSGIAVEAFGEFFGWLSAIAMINFLALYVQPFFQSAG
jgi:hypothetical protein